MFKNFRWKLTGSYFLLILLILIIVGGMVFYGFKDYYLQSLEQRMTQEAYLIADMVKYVESDKTNAYQQICDKAARDSATRISIINKDGVVLGDSQFNASELDSHKSRPEVYQALHGKVGVAMRYSKTEKINMLYVAVPIDNQTQSGVVRIAMPLAELAAINKRILMIMLLALMLIAIIAVLLSLIMAKKISEPLDEITTAVQDIAGGNLRRRIGYQSDDELGFLANSFNDMSENIEQGIIALNEVSNRFQALLDNTVNGIIMVDIKGVISYANPAALYLLNLKEDIVGRNKTEVINNYEILETIDKVKSEMQPESKEIVLHYAGGKTAEVNIVPIIGNDLKNQGILVVINDISELKRLDQVRKDFVANVSHELKTPLASISGFAETLIDEGGVNPETVMEFSRIIYAEAQRLTAMVNGLLELSHLESEKTEVSFQPTDIDAVLNSTLALVQHQQLPQMIKLEYIPAASRPVISSDSDLIMQVVSNLLDNAIKYSPEGGTVKLQLEDLEKTVKINVIDTGIGIPAQELPRIFERFYRVDKARSRKTGGSGLGLAIVKHLVEKLGGQVFVESILGAGSTFTVVLPKTNNSMHILQK